MTTRSIHLWSPFLILLSLFPAPLRAQSAVNVTMEAAVDTLRVGETTTVTVYGQIDPSIEADSDQIFSWYIDVLNDDGAVLGGYGNVTTPTSDNHPDTSGDGTPDASHLRGVYDTFLSQAGAGKGSRVVLVQFEVLARSPGTGTLSVGAGTTVGPLSDFLVSKSGIGSYFGGVYSGASVAITVTRPELDLTVTRTADQAEITFNPIPGFSHTLQFSDTLQVPSWSDVPGGPHDAGIVNQPVAGFVRRFYRVCVTPP